MSSPGRDYLNSLGKVTTNPLKLPILPFEADLRDKMMDDLNKEGDLFDCRFGGAIYPKSVLAAYDRVMTGRWNIDHGNPEKVIDDLLKSFMDSVPNKLEYLGMLKTALMDDKIKTCLVLRLTYAALLEKSTDEIVVHTNKRASLTCQDQLVTDPTDDSVIYIGDSPVDMEADEINRRADEFYAQKTVVSQSVSGIELDKREKLAQKVVDLGFEFVNDRELVYSELMYYANDYETALVARLAFLLLTKDDNISPKLLA